VKSLVVLEFSGLRRDAALHGLSRP
jgi:hypothetical protein